MRDEQFDILLAYVTATAICIIGFMVNNVLIVLIGSVGIILLIITTIILRNDQGVNHERR
jgi:hypothetical protein